MVQKSTKVEKVSPALIKPNPYGIKNILATECSNPIATKEEMGTKMPKIFPGSVLEAVAIQIARHTSQLAKIPRVNACRDTIIQILYVATGMVEHRNQIILGGTITQCRLY